MSKAYRDYLANLKEGEEDKYFIIRPNGTRRLIQSTSGVSRTKQSQASSADIKNIMKKYKKTGILPHVNRKIYGDFSNPQSLVESLEVVNKAAEQFNGLSADIRNKFRNDPVKFLEFCENPQNKDEMVQLGLMEVTEPETETTKSGESVSGSESKVVEETKIEGESGESQ